MSNFVQVDTKSALKNFSNIKHALTKDIVAKGTMRALNETIKLQRTQVRQSVRKGYNMPGNKVALIDANLARQNNLTSEIFASQKPIQLAYFKPSFSTKKGTIKSAFSKKDGKIVQRKVKATKVKGVTIEIKKGDKKNISFAFMIDGRTPVFARGQYKKGAGFVKSKERKPISPLVTLSPYSAAFGLQKLPPIANTALQDFEKRMIRNIKYLAQKAIEKNV